MHLVDTRPGEKKEKKKAKTISIAQGFREKIYVLHISNRVWLAGGVEVDRNPGIIRLEYSPSFTVKDGSTRQMGQ